ncbi:MAG: LysR substrate-binding domain-containing protein [Hydrogenophaga sp.]|uniref:LysR substrate-binding domain-containing protein n=1 Tax=Hydrogenophaga sp. TaxID=1904254 RepID=UPI002718E51B|nr:LysR substrate-binding domain-containing protein [Hydrogenophaga sp.]MDO9483789.1 LysR substrate-binding domain-containing protein [Hydrogenophaga sp.]MDP3346967.1 LysR substrate-binding domain-containing protein [Hydrogenophaga sp.]MDP3805173.1 LysR substrate-binding domain-containing protein [Hydrogenophaga sp.]MDZ4128091.1 LysR substrate-binding domain-containing protein [Hydrogenophaga sp.]MDZ4240201.1 LysR substrate-binding domain-containing protein [Hydrogenophaga sp.]
MSHNSKTSHIPKQLKHKDHQQQATHDVRIVSSRFPASSRQRQPGRLRIAAVTTAEYFVPDLLGPFAALHPGVEIDLAIENRDRVIARLHRQADDLTVMMLPPDDLPLQSLPFLDNPLVVLVPLPARPGCVCR